MIYTLDHLFLKELRERFVEKILDEWHEKWHEFPLLEEDNFEKLSNHFDPFLDKLRYDIYETLLSFSENKADEAKKTPSKPTLRRILLNKNEIASLQYNTRNSVALYCGYTSWEHFIEQTDNLIRGKYFGLVHIPKVNEPENQPEGSTPGYPIFVPQPYPPTVPIYGEVVKPSLWQTMLGKTILTTIMLLAGATIGHFGYNWYKNRPFTQAQKDAVTFEIIDSYDKPNSGFVKIRYDVSALNPDSVAIEFGEEENFLTGTKKGVTDANYVEYYKKAIDTISHQYNKPNVWQIKLNVNGQVVKTLTKIVYSGNEWTTWAAGRSNENYWSGKIIAPQLAIQNGIIQLRNADIGKQGLDYYSTKHQLNKDFPIDGDSCFIEARIRDSEAEGGLRYYTGAISFIDSARNIMHLKAVQDAVGATTLRIADTNLPGTKYLNKYLDINLQDWRILGIKLKDQTAYIYLDGKEIHKVAYKGSFGNIKGLKLATTGSGSVDWIRLSNSYTGKEVFFDDFIR
jgi:hypothetical protein